MNATMTLWEPQGWWREVTVERGMRGTVRMCVSFGHESSDQPEKCLGADLTPDECRQLARLLEAAAISAEAGGAQ